MQLSNFGQAQHRAGFGQMIFGREHPEKMGGKFGGNWSLGRTFLHGEDDFNFVFLLLN
jgi:hypothetical protein